MSHLARMVHESKTSSTSYTLFMSNTSNTSNTSYKCVMHLHDAWVDFAKSTHTLNTWYHAMFPHQNNFQSISAGSTPRITYLQITTSRHQLTVGTDMQTTDNRQNCTQLCTQVSPSTDNDELCEAFQVYGPRANMFRGSSHFASPPTETISTCNTLSHFPHGAFITAQLQPFSCPTPYAASAPYLRGSWHMDSQKVSVGTS